MNAVAVHSIPPLNFCRVWWGDKSTDMAIWTASLVFQLWSAFCVYLCQVQSISYICLLILQQYFEQTEKEKYVKHSSNKAGKDL